MKAKLDDNDARLFREAVGDVKPLRHDRYTPAPRKRAGKARFSRANRIVALDESLSAALNDPAVGNGDELSFRRPGIPERTLRKLRRGEYRIEGEIDLHGLTVAQATTVLRDFLVMALARRVSCVRIIHGKGLRSGQGGPVLKSLVTGVLRRNPAAVAFVSARPRDGGTGASYVLLSH